MRIRSIKPEFWRSDDVAALPWETRLLFVGLWSYVDDNGVGRDDERIIRAELFALDRDLTESSLRVQTGLNALHAAGLIERYTINGKKFLHICTWSKHQKINRPSPGRYPLPTSESAEIHAPLTEDSVSPQREPSPGAVDQWISGSVDKETCSPAAPSNVIDLPVNSSGAGKKLATKPGDPKGFAEFWSIYPRRVARGEAVKAFAKALRTAELSEILDGARRYADDPDRKRKDPTYTAHAATWLHAERWTDEPTPGRTSADMDESVEAMTARLIRQQQETNP